MKRLAFIASTVIFSVATWIVYPGYSPDRKSEDTAVNSTDEGNSGISAFIVQQDIISFVTETGTVRYKTLYNVNTEVSGKFKACHFKAGDRVKKGDLILELENKKLKKSYNTAVLNLKRAKQTLSHYNTYVKLERETNIQIQYETMKVKYEHAEEALVNSEECLKRGMISKKECKKIVREHKNAKKLLELEKLKLEKQAELDRQEEEKLNHLEKQNREELQEIEKRISYLNIHAPITGKILELSKLFPSEYVKSNIIPVSKGSLVASIAEEEGRYVEVKLFGQDITELKMNDIVEVLPGTSNEKILEGRIRDISPVGVPYGQYYRYPVLIEVLSDTDSLRPGSLVRCRFLVSERKGTASIPINFLFYKDGMQYCKIKVDDEIKKVPVVTGIDDGQHVEIISGLDIGQKICM